MIITSTVTTACMIFFVKYATKKGLDKLLDKIKQQDYNTELRKVIAETVDNYHEKHPIPNLGRKFPFYQSQILFDHFCDYLFFEEQIDLNSLTQKLNENKNIIPVNEMHLKRFLEIFYDTINENKLIRNLFIKDNYQKEIFSISSSLDLVAEDVNQIKETVQAISDSNSRLLYKAKEAVNSFKPKTAIQILKMVDLDDLNNQRLAEYYYIFGLANGEMNKSEVARNSYLKAYELNQKENKYKKKVVVIFATEKKDDLALDITKQIFIERPHDPVGWAVKCYIKNSRVIDAKCLNLVPSIVHELDNCNQFESTLAKLVSKVEEAKLLFEKNILSEEMPKKIDFENKSYWSSLINGFYQIYVTRVPTDLYTPINHLNFPNLKWNYLKDLLDLLIETFKETEKFQFLLHHRFVSAHLNYIIQPNIDNCTAMESIFRSISVDKRDFYTFPLAVSLSQMRMFDKVVGIQNEKSSILPYIKATASFELEEYEKAYSFSKKYLDRNHVFADYTFGHLIQIIVQFLPNDESERMFIEERIHNAQFENSIASDLALMTLNWDKLDSEKSKDQLIELSQSAGDVGIVYIRILIPLLMRVNLNTLACNVLRPLIDFNIPSPEHEMYIINLSLSNTNHIELLNRLKNWRRIHGRKIIDFYIQEIQLLGQIPNWSKVEKVALEARNSFPKIPSITLSYLTSLYEQNKIDCLKENLSDNILNIEFSEIEVFEIFRLSILSDKITFGLELLFPYAANPVNKLSREQYYFTLNSLDNYTFDEVKEVVLGTYALVEVNETKKVIMVNEKTMANDEIVKLIIGKKEGEEAVFRRELDSHSIPINIIKTLDKFQGLYYQIHLELENPATISRNYSKFNAESIEDFEKQLIKSFAAKDISHARAIENILKSYKNRQVSFSEVVLAFGSDPIRTYRYLTSSSGEGVTIQPERFFENVSFDKNYKLTFRREKVIENFKNG